jgi:hypothetical protein
MQHSTRLGVCWIGREIHGCCERYEGLYKPLIQAVPSREKWVTSAIFKKYLQCVLAARILTVDFVVCTLAVKKESGQVSTCRIWPFPCKLNNCIISVADEVSKVIGHEGGYHTGGSLLQRRVRFLGAEEVWQRVSIHYSMGQDFRAKVKYSSTKTSNIMYEYMGILMPRHVNVGNNFIIIIDNNIFKYVDSLRLLQWQT